MPERSTRKSRGPRTARARVSKLNIPIDVAQADPCPAGLPVVVGVPFRKGVVKDISRLRVASASGEVRPAAARTLVTHPDGSVRWALVSFTARERGEHRLTLGKDAGAGPAQGVRLTEDQGRITLDNGVVKVVLASSGPGPVERVEAHGQPMLDRPEAFRLCVDGANTTHEQQRSLRIIESTPVRARVRVEGAHFDNAGNRKLTYRLDVELWAGWPVLRLDYHFFNLEPGVEAVQIGRMAVECDLAVDGSAAERHFLQAHHGVFYRPREVRHADNVAIVTDDSRSAPHVEDPAMLRDDVQYPRYLDAPLVETAGWLGVVAGGRGVYMTMEDFAAMQPKRLYSAGSHLGLEVWPQRAGTLSLPQGWSRRQVVTLAFADSDQAMPAWISSALSAPIGEGRATVSPEYLVTTGEFSIDAMLPRGKHVRFERYLRSLIQLEMPATMFDLGDTRDPGYSRTYVPLGLSRVPRLPNAPALPRIFDAGQGGVISWLPHIYEPVWTNNEYDVIHAFCIELMRTGRQELFTTLRRAARHNIEVDFLHYNDDRWHHRATPAHSVRHTTTGAYPSHFWTQGLLEYFCLTGDVDALEVAVGLGDKIIESFTDPGLRPVLWGFNRELGWPVLSLACLVDVTGEQRFRTQLDELVDYLVNFDRRGFRGAINLSNVNPRLSMERQMLNAFFGYASMLEGVHVYAKSTGRRDVRKWLVTLLTQLRDGTADASREGEGIDVRTMVPQAMAIGYELTRDKRFIDAGMVCLDAFIESSAWSNPPHQTKPVAMLHRGLVQFLGQALGTGRLDRLEFPTLRKR